MTTVTLYEGDSSDVISVTVTYNGSVVESLTGYTGTFSVVRNLGDAAIFSKAMTAVGSAFRVSIIPEESELLTAGTYTGVVEVENESLDYKKEQHILISVEKQGAA